MTLYYNKSEIHNSMKILAKNYLEECIARNELSQGCIDLIKHNFLAKFVHYNPEKKSIEIGVEQVDPDGSYPEIKVYSYPVKSKSWLDKSFKEGKCDLDFYGKLLNSDIAEGKNANVVVI